MNPIVFAMLAYWWMAPGFPWSAEIFYSTRKSEEQQ